MLDETDIRSNISINASVKSKAKSHTFLDITPADGGEKENEN